MTQLALLKNQNTSSILQLTFQTGRNKSGFSGMHCYSTAIFYLLRGTHLKSGSWIKISHTIKPNNKNHLFSSFPLFMEQIIINSIFLMFLHGHCHTLDVTWRPIDVSFYLGEVSKKLLGTLLYASTSRYHSKFASTKKWVPFNKPQHFPRLRNLNYL